MIGEGRRVLPRTRRVWTSLDAVDGSRGQVMSSSISCGVQFGLRCEGPEHALLSVDPPGRRPETTTTARRNSSPI